MIAKGRGINEKDQYGNTPLQHAALWRDLEIVTKLIEHGADVTARGGFKDFTPLHSLSNVSGRPEDSQKIIQMMQLLLNKGADPLVRNFENQRPLDVTDSRGEVYKFLKRVTEEREQQ